MSNLVKVQVFFIANTWKEYFKLKFVELVVILQILENPFMHNVQSTLLGNILVIRKNKNNFVYMQWKTIAFLPVSWGWNRQCIDQLICLSDYLKLISFEVIIIGLYINTVFSSWQFSFPLGSLDSLPADAARKLKIMLIYRWNVSRSVSSGCCL